MARARGVAYVHEPFHPEWRRPGLCRAPFADFLTYITRENEGDFAEALRDTMALRYRLGKGLAGVRSLRDESCNPVENAEVCLVTSAACVPSSAIVLGRK